MLRLRDIVDRDVVSVSPDMPVHEAARLLAQYRIGLAPVVQQGKVLGLVSLGLVQRATDDPNARIRDLSYESYHALPPETDLTNALAFARQANAEHVLVLDQGRLIGIVPTVRIQSSIALV